MSPQCNSCISLFCSLNSINTSPYTMFPNPNQVAGSEHILESSNSRASSMDAQQKGSQPPTTKIERKIIEKNRRNHMKDLCFKLNSLLPNFNPREPVPRVERIDEAIKYIKSLEARIKMAKVKKERLLLTGRKRFRDCGSSAFETNGSLKRPTVKVHQLGSRLEVVLTCGFDNQFIFNEIIRILHEENVEVVCANSSLAGDSMLHVVHAEIQQFYQLGATQVSERLTRFVNGHWQDFQGAKGGPAHPNQFL